MAAPARRRGRPTAMLTTVAPATDACASHDSSSDSDMDVDEMVTRAAQLLAGAGRSSGGSANSRSELSDDLLLLDAAGATTDGRISVGGDRQSTAAKRSGAAHSAAGRSKTKKSSLDIASSLKIAPSLTKDLYLTSNPGRTAKSVAQDRALDKEDQLMKQSAITSGFEKQHSVPAADESKRRLLKQRRLERSKTKGSGWYDMPATELTEEKKNDLMVLQMRHVLDPKRFYKGNDMKAIPKYFQMGKVVEGPADFYNGRIPKKQRKATIVDELLADAEFRSYNKKKYMEINASKLRSKGAFKHAKRLKKKK